MSWHTHYRPRAVADLHLSDVRELLVKLMKSGVFPQVFLCAGPKGTGKTSTARLLGAILNDPQNDAAVEALFFGKKSGSKKSFSLQEADPTTSLAEAIFAGNSFMVQEMDAASNRGIDDVRQLKERVQLPPQDGKMAVYILDEVHMLTNEAFNALLKLLEEPPAHAVFVLATTELHKVPATIQSRCVVLPFRKATIDEIVSALDKVSVGESLTIDPEATALIAQLADGSFRDAVKSLEMVASVVAGQKITKKVVEEVLQAGFLDSLPTIIKAVIAKDSTQIVTQISQLRETGLSSTVVQKALVSFLHQDLVLAVKQDNAALFSLKISHFLLQELSQVPYNQPEPIPLLLVELKLLELVFRAQQKSGGGTGVKKKSRQMVSSKKMSSGKMDSSTYEATATLVSSAASMPLAVIDPQAEMLLHSDNLLDPVHVDTKPLLEAWGLFVDAVTAENSTLGAFLRSAKPLTDESNGVAKIEVYYAFHRDQLQQPRFMDMLKKCAEPFLGSKPGFEFVLNSKSEAGLADELLM